jgi:hypothetical protein
VISTPPVDRFIQRTVFTARLRSSGSMDKLMKSTMTYTIVLRLVFIFVFSVGLCSFSGCRCTLSWTKPFLCRKPSAERCGGPQASVPPAATNPQTTLAPTAKPSGSTKAVQKVVARVPSHTAANTVASIANRDPLPDSQLDSKTNISSRRSVLSISPTSTRVGSTENSVNRTSNESISGEKKSGDAFVRDPVQKQENQDVLKRANQTNSGQPDDATCMLPSSATVEGNSKNTDLTAQMALQPSFPLPAPPSAEIQGATGNRDLLRPIQTPEDQPNVSPLRVAQSQPTVGENGSFPSLAGSLRPVVRDMPSDDQTAVTSLPHGRKDWVTTRREEDDLQTRSSEPERYSPHDISSNSAVPAASNMPPSAWHSVAPIKDDGQRLVLELRDRGWPAQTVLDPVKRAYQLREQQKSEAHFRDWQHCDPNEPASIDSSDSGSPMRTAGYRYSHRASPLSGSRIADPWNSGYEERSNWIPSRHAEVENTGLKLNAIPGSTRVQIAPLVSMSSVAGKAPGFQSTPGWDEQDGNKDNPPMETVPTRDAPVVPPSDPRQMIDLPVSDSIRRLTVRPSEGEPKTLER